MKNPGLRLVAPAPEPARKKSTEFREINDLGTCHAGVTVPGNPQPTDFEAASDSQREAAARRLAAAVRAEELRAKGHSRAEADRLAGDEAGVSARSVGGWRTRIRGLPPGERLAALIDAPRSGRPRREWGGAHAADLWEMWCSDYVREEAPDAAAVHRRLAVVACARGWTLPPLDAFVRRTRRELSRGALVRGREGALAAMDTVPHQTRTVEGLAPLEIVNGDGRRHDVIVELPSGRVGRPVVWVWQDIRTRRILAWRAGETESADLVRTSLHEVIDRWGVPGRVVVDSTLAASAKWMTGGQPNRRRWKSSGEELPGLLGLLDIDYRVTAVDTDAAGRGRGRGRSKPVERAFLDLSNQIDTHPLLAGAYTGRSTQDRPETHRTRVASWADFVTVVERCVIEHNARPGRRTEAAAGRSFDAVWAEEYSASVVRRLAPSQAAVLLLAAEPSRVDASGCVRINAGRGAGLPANRYHDGSLVDRAGERVTVRFDPADLHAGVQVYDRDGRWICRAACVAKVGFADAAAARDYERSRRRARKAAEAELAARRDMDALVEAMRDLPAAAEPDAPEPAATALVAASGGAPAPPRDRKKFMAALRRLNLHEEP